MDNAQEMEQRSLVCRMAKVYFKVIFNSLMLLLNKVLSRNVLSVVFEVMTYLRKRLVIEPFCCFLLK